MTFPEIIHKVSEDTNLPPEIVYKAYRAYWLFIRNSIQELPLKDDLTEIEFLQLKTNFNIPSLGKLSCTYPRYLAIKEKFNNIRKLRNEEAKED
jgi:hypothetical protein